MNAKRLERAQQKLATTVPTMIGKVTAAGLDPNYLGSLDGLKQWCSFVGGLLYEKKISAPEAQAFAALGRLAATVFTLENEARTLDLEGELE